MLRILLQYVAIMSPKELIESMQPMPDFDADCRANTAHLFSALYNALTHEKISDTEKDTDTLQPIPMTRPFCVKRDALESTILTLNGFDHADDIMLSTVSSGDSSVFQLCVAMIEGAYTVTYSTPSVYYIPVEFGLASNCDGSSIDDSQTELPDLKRRKMDDYYSSDSGQSNSSSDSQPIGGVQQNMAAMCETHNTPLSYALPEPNGTWPAVTNPEAMEVLQRLFMALPTFL